VKLVLLVKLALLVKLVLQVQQGQPVKPDQPVQLVKQVLLVQWDLPEVLGADFLYLQLQIHHLISRKIPRTIFLVSLQ
jgi:hypothetical protein